MSSYFGVMSTLYFVKFNFNYKDLEEYFHSLSINLQHTSGNSKSNLCCVSHGIGLHF